MIICIPVNTTIENSTVEISNHFGSAPYYAIFNTDSQTTKVIVNTHSEHEHGQCVPIDFLKHEKIQIVILKGIGRGALNKLRHSGIKVYSTVAVDYPSALLAFVENQLKPFDDLLACHGTHDG